MLEGVSLALFKWKSLTYLTLSVTLCKNATFFLDWRITQEWMNHSNEWMYAPYVFFYTVLPGIVRDWHWILYDYYPSVAKVFFQKKKIFEVSKAFKICNLYNSFFV